MARTQVILTVIGSDRPGLTRQLAGAIQDAGGNWLESHLSRLGGKYVGSVLVEIEDSAIGALRDAARHVDSAGLAVSLVGAEPGPPELREGLVVELLGQDRPGIIREVTEVIAGLGANIDSLSSSTRSGAWSGERLFGAVLSVTLPEGLDAGRLRESLEELSGEMMVDLSVRSQNS